MPFVMELPVFTTFKSVPRFSDSPLSSKCFFVGRLKLSKAFNLRKKSKCSLRVSTILEAKNGGEEDRVDYGGVRFLGNSQFVEVIGIGSRKDAVLDFCWESPFQLTSSLRFWNINVKDPKNVQLQERFLDQDLNPRILEPSQFLQSCSKAVILVASAGYSLDHVIAVDVLKTVRSTNGFAIAIFLRPFSFEGKRRQDEVHDLVGKLKDHTNFCIDIDTDTLLKKDLVTLDEALKTANTAVLLAINAISVLISEMHQKVIGVQLNNVKELKVFDIVKILESYKEAKIGFGAGNSIKSSILQALYDCPFIGAGVENINGIIICIIASSGFIENNDVSTPLLTFRQSAKYMGEIIISTIHEPNLDSDMLVTTVFTVGCNEVQTPQRSSLLSRLAKHIPFVFKLLRVNHQQLPDNEEINGLGGEEVSNTINLHDSGVMESKIAIDSRTNGTTAKGIDKRSEEHETLQGTNYYDTSGSRNYNNEAEDDTLDYFDARIESSDNYDQNTEGTAALQREPLASWNLGPGYKIAQEWAKERAGASSMLDNLSIFCLPVGVRSSGEFKEGLNISYSAELSEPKNEDAIKEQKNFNSSISSWDVFADAGFLVRDFYNNASTVLKGRNADVPKKQGILSVRAASMLEAERDSPKKWSPIKEMPYRGGVYRGRCQGGLPEGKGRLILEDGSIYEGIWRYGKRAGPGAFYFSNGDVFQGSWRDDVMHGKGWFYFHTGDRWFANFWKGKANGESRFYSKSGEVFFGQFQDGWRHGEFLCIDVDGARWGETWEEGILVSRKHMDSDAETE